MLLINSSETFTITLLYRKNKEGELEILDKEPEEGTFEKDTFEFKKPAWGEVRTIINRSTVGGNLNDVDPMAFMDAKIRTLLRSWSLKNDKGRSLGFDQLENFPPSVVIHLNNEIDKVLGTEGLFGMKSPRI